MIYIKTAVRYYSHKGNTKLIAQALAKGLGVEAVSVDEEDSLITEKLDVLFVGASLYSHKISKKFKNYIYSLSLEKVDRVVIFSNALPFSKAVSLITDYLYHAGIVVERIYSVPTLFGIKPNRLQLRRARKFAKRYKEKSEL